MPRFLPRQTSASPSVRIGASRPLAPVVALSVPRSESIHPVFCHFTLSHAELKSRTFHRLCLSLVANGFDVRYLSPASIEGPYSGMHHVRLPRLSGRLRQMLSWPQLLAALLRQRPALYHFQDPELLPVALLLKIIFRKRVLYDAYEDFPSMALQSSRVPPWLRRAAFLVVAAAERLAARHFDGILTADPITLRRLARNGRSRKMVLYNFPNLDFFPAPAKKSGPKEFDLVYRGGLSERAGTYVLLEALHILQQQGSVVRLLLIGYSDSFSAEAQLRETIRSLGIENSTQILGRIPHEQMASALSRACIGISPLLSTPKFEINIPVKVFEYWACGLPVIASDLRPMRPFFRSANAGLLVPPGDSHSLALAILWMLGHPADAARMGRAGRVAIENRFNNCSEAARFSRFCRRIIAA